MTNRREITPPLGFSTPPQIPNNTSSERPPVTTTVFATTTPENTLFAYHASTLTLLKERRRQICNEDLRTKLGYFNKDYDEEREMEPRPERRREATSTLRLREGNRRGRNAEGIRPSKIEAREGHQPSNNMGGNLPPNGTLLSHHSQPFIPSSLHIPTLGICSHPFKHSLLSTVCEPCLWTSSEFPFPDPNSQQKKFTKTHLAVHNIKQREGESTRAFITRHTDETLQILDLPFTYKGLMEKTYTLVEAREVATNGASSDRRDSFERPKKSYWDNNKGQRNKDRFSPYRGPNHGLLPSLSKSPKEILATEKTARSFEPPPKMFGNYGGKEIIFPPVAKVNNAPVIIEAKIFGRKVGRVYMDSRSSCEIIYEHCFEKLNPTIKATKVDLKTPLVGFSGERSWSIGEVPLEIAIGDAPLSRTETLNFVIVRFDSSYNMLLGRTAMQRMGIVVSTIHGAIKFHTKKGIATVLSTNEADEGTKRARKIPATNEERVLSCVNAEEKIISNADVFAWTHADMTRIPRTIMVEGKPFNTEHKLNEYSHVKLGLGLDRNMAACKETEELMNAGILRKVKYQTWVANPVMVKKSDGGWRMFVDFTDINKACPKDCYPLPEIDWKIESLLGFRLKCFLDAYKGYHQIQMAEEDEDKTAFYARE
ncbi:reverse transcriptase domain-containing protein [Tanacetum coccineum]